MVTTQELFSALFHTTQKNQHLLITAESYARSHALKSLIRGQILEFDQLESDIQYIFARRGWDLAEIQPVDRWVAGLSFRCRSDASIAEHLIRLHAKDTIRILKLRNRWHCADEQTSMVIQKFLDCKLICTRQMQPYL